MSSLKKNLKLAGGVALSFSVFYSAKSYSMEYGLCGNFGASFMGSKFIFNESYLGPKKNDEKKKLEDAKVGITLPFGAGLFFGMNFGDDGAEMFGFEIDAKFSKLGYCLEVADDSSKSKEVKDSSNNLKSEFSSMGVAIGVAGRFLFLNYDGGSMFVKLGVDGHFGFIKDFDLKKGDKSIFSTEDNAPEVAKELSKDLKKSALEACQLFNIAPKLGIGATFADEIVSVGVTTRLWVLNMYESVGSFKKFTESNGNTFKGFVFGKMAMDVSLSLGVNFAPMFA